MSAVHPNREYSCMTCAQGGQVSSFLQPQGPAAQCAGTGAAVLPRGRSSSMARSSLASSLQESCSLRAAV